MLSMTFELVSFKPLAVQGKCFSRYMKNLGARNPKREVRVMIERSLVDEHLPETPSTLPGYECERARRALRKDDPISQISTE
jgi:hypothetical protein